MPGQPAAALTGRMMQIRNAEKLPRNAMTRPKPGKMIAVPAHKQVTTVRLITRRYLYRGIAAGTGISAWSFDNRCSGAGGAYSCEWPDWRVSLIAESTGNAIGCCAEVMPRRPSMVRLSCRQ